MQFLLPYRLPSINDLPRAGFPLAQRTPALAQRSAHAAQQPVAATGLRLYPLCCSYILIAFVFCDLNVAMLYGRGRPPCRDLSILPQPSHRSASPLAASVSATGLRVYPGTVALPSVSPLSGSASDLSGGVARPSACPPALRCLRQDNPCIPVLVLRSLLPLSLNQPQLFGRGRPPCSGLLDCRSSALPRITAPAARSPAVRRRTVLKV
jgi:hypothetical protein